MGDIIQRYRERLPFPLNGERIRHNRISCVEPLNPKPLLAWPSATLSSIPNGEGRGEESLRFMGRAGVRIPRTSSRFEPLNRVRPLSLPSPPLQAGVRVAEGRERGRFMGRGENSDRILISSERMTAVPPYLTLPSPLPPGAERETTASVRNFARGPSRKPRSVFAS